MQAVLYLRVSTKEQGTSRNGLEAQEATLQAFCEREAITVLACCKEVASGGLDVSGRPVLARALEEARRQSACLLVAKLDRLSRDVHVIAGLMKAHVKFYTAEDGLDVDPMMLHIKAVFAEKERAMISQRTSAALQAKRARGEALGVHTHKDRATTAARAQAASGAASKARSDAFAVQVAPMLKALRGAGRTMAQTAEALNAAGLKSARGGVWSATTVCNALQRIK